MNDNDNRQSDEKKDTEGAPEYRSEDHRGFIDTFINSIKESSAKGTIIGIIIIVLIFGILIFLLNTFNHVAK